MRAPNTVSSTCSLLLWWIHTLHWCWWGLRRWWSLLNHHYYRNNLSGTIVFFHKSQLIKKMVRMTIMLTKLILGGGGGRCWQLRWCCWLRMGGARVLFPSKSDQEALVCFGLEVNTLQLLQEVKAYIDDKRIFPFSKISAWRQHRTWLTWYFLFQDALQLFLFLSTYLSHVIWGNAWILQHRNSLIICCLCLWCLC